MLLGVNVLIALLFDFDQIVDINALTARETFGGFGGLAVFVEGGLQRRAAHHRIERRLLRREIAHEEALPARRGKALDRVVLQAGVLQHLRREFAQLRQRRSDIGRRQFLDANLKHKRGRFFDRWLIGRWPLVAG